MNSFFIKQSNNSLGATADHGKPLQQSAGNNVGTQGGGSTTTTGDNNTTQQRWQYKPDWDTGALPVGLAAGGGALLGGLSGRQPLRTGIGTGLGALGGYLAWDYFSKNPNFQKNFKDLQGWAKTNLWEGAENHIQYAAPALGGLLGYLISK